MFSQTVFTSDLKIGMPMFTALARIDLLALLSLWCFSLSLGF